jgi:hypothetical protein
MTPALGDRPPTALDLLVGPHEQAREALTEQLLSASARVGLEAALDNLAQVTREATVREVTDAVAGLLDADLIGLLAAGWRKHHDLVAAARRTLATPGSTELIDMASHQITTAHHPSVTVLIDGRRVATLHLGLFFVFDVIALSAKISAGQLVALHSGRCEITATLAIQGTNVLTRQAHLDLPGTIPLSRGIRLLAAHSYSADTRQATNADDTSA